ncbi:MAG: hypothetical protein JWN70_5807 [Planctomycetaceae bacterium]|nr:hypothetical protein [Planctomycetaceae bacterium]
MALPFAQVYDRLGGWAEAHSLRVENSVLAAGKAGQFDGITITINSFYAPDERTYYLVHALGSNVGWSLNKSGVQGMFDELREAKVEKNSKRLEVAINRYRAFEDESSAFAVSILDDLGARELISSYTNFMRADLEALTVFHRCGQAPVWRDFFSQWNTEVSLGWKKVLPFQAKPVPPFLPLRIRPQEILQQQPEP